MPPKTGLLNPTKFDEVTGIFEQIITDKKDMTMASDTEQSSDPKLIHDLKIEQTINYLQSLAKRQKSRQGKDKVIEAAACLTTMRDEKREAVDNFKAEQEARKDSDEQYTNLYNAIKGIRDKIDPLRGYTAFATVQQIQHYIGDITHERVMAMERSARMEDALIALHKTCTDPGTSNTIEAMLMLFHIPIVEEDKK